MEYLCKLNLFSYNKTNEMVFNKITKFKHFFKPVYSHMYYWIKFRFFVLRVIWFNNSVYLPKNKNKEKYYIIYCMKYWGNSLSSSLRDLIWYRSVTSLSTRVSFSVPKWYTIVLHCGKRKCRRRKEYTKCKVFLFLSSVTESLKYFTTMKFYSNSCKLCPTFS